MKTIWIALLLNVTLFCPVLLQSQSQGGGCGSSGPEHFSRSKRTSHPERLTLLFNHTMAVHVECREILEIPLHSDSSIWLIHRHLEFWKDSLGSMATPLLITFAPEAGGHVRVTVMPDTLPPFETVYSTSDNTYTPTRFPYVVVFPFDYRNTLVLHLNHINDLHRLTGAGLDSLVYRAQQHTSSLEIKGFIAKSSTYNVSQSSLDTATAHIHQHADRGISISINTGLSYLNGTFAPSVAVPLLFVQSRKTGHPRQFGLAFDMLLDMDPEKPYRIRNNWYAEAQYRFTRTQTTLFAGYLIHRNGDLLPPDACRVGLDIKINKSQVLALRTAYHFSLSQSGQNLFEIGVRVGW